MSFELKTVSFPFRIGTVEAPEVVSNAALIAESIADILCTAIGERPMVPTYGSRLHELVFENNGAFLTERIKREVCFAIEAWEPRATVADVGVKYYDDGTVVVTVYFSYEEETYGVNVPMNMLDLLSA